MNPAAGIRMQMEPDASVLLQLPQRAFKGVLTAHGLPTGTLVVVTTALLFARGRLSWLDKWNGLMSVMMTSNTRVAGEGSISPFKISRDELKGDNTKEGSSRLKCGWLEQRQS
jgi:hypothetical protein